MLRHQLSQDLVLGLDILLSILDAFLLGLVVGPRFLLESGGTVLKELLLPTVEDSRLQPQLVTEVRDRHFLKQMAPQGGDLLFCGVVLALFFQAFSPLSSRVDAFSISS